jgi:hypothetical protein
MTIRVKTDLTRANSQLGRGLRETSQRWPLREKYHSRMTHTGSMTRSRHRMSIREKRNLTRTVSQICRRSKRTSRERCQGRRY